MKSNEKIIEFNKRFANGEQFIYLDSNNEIQTEEKQYFWQERGVYNHIAPIIESLQSKNNLTDEYLYGENGLVSRLIPIQRAYNSVKNRKQEYLARLTSSVICVEDGTVDLDDLEEEGISAGKIIVYRQGSTPPQQLEANPDIANILSNEEDRLLFEMYQLANFDKKREE